MKILLVCFILGLLVAMVRKSKNKQSKSNKIIIDTDARDKKLREEQKKKLEKQMKDGKCPKCHIYHPQNYTGIGREDEGVHEYFYTYYKCKECGAEWKILNFHYIYRG